MVANPSKSGPSCPMMTNLPNSHEIWNLSPLWDALGNISLPCDFLKICPNLCHPFLWWPIYAIAMKFETFLCWGSFVATFLYPVISSVHFCQSVYLKVWCRMSKSSSSRSRAWMWSASCSRFCDTLYYGQCRVRGLVLLGSKFPFVHVSTYTNGNFDANKTKPRTRRCP